MGILAPSRLEKATLIELKKGLASTGRHIKVQFNPSQYQISRSMRVSNKYGIGQDPDISKMQAVCGDFATLTLTLYFDTESQRLFGGLLGALVNFYQTPPTESGAEIATLLKYNDEEHAPLKVRFVWSSLDFMGYVCNSSITYTMFSPDGTPIRAKVDLTIRGEETALLQKKLQLTFCSPNRTKERMLTEGDQLWMTAQQEYDNPAMWKPIAAANGILNPRRLDHVTTLKVPSIK